MDRMLARFVDELLETAHVVDSLDEAAQAEAWASGAVAEWIDLGGEAGDLVEQIEGPAPLAAALVRWLVEGRTPSVGPDWLSDLDAQEPVEAWLLRAGVGGESEAMANAPEAETAVIVEFEAPSGARHAVSVTVADGRVVDCGIGPPGLAAAAGEDEATSMTVTSVAVDEAIGRIRDALGQLRSEDLSVNGRLNIPLALRRFEVVPTERFDARGDHHAVVIPARDAEDDAWAAELLRSALRLHDAAASMADAPEHALAADTEFEARLAAGDPDAHTVLDVAGAAGNDASGANESDKADPEVGPAGVPLILRAAAAYLRPADLSVHPTATQTAILELEWADWLGAILGLARSEVGTEVDGATLVRLINRCPEITTTIPKQDASRIGWAFEQTLYAWAVTGVLDEAGRLTDAGRWLLPRAALAAWDGQSLG